ncbi:rhomboid family intramembrane serine protease [uncultured Alistipes sp.]|uniref:rhomboid family intramembrane serine protease n=1 Tax=uncultured Alistipes sp. TaxID=538949 RepID=UPI00263662BE|nr:rhomboid family intramembrane serine protease [uncultured Alistipes sp.]
MRFQGAYATPPVVKNLIILNGLFYLAQTVLPGGTGEWMVRHLGLWFWESGRFGLHQLVTHMFLHGSLTHLFMNMFALWMFGRTLEYELGSRRFLSYYMVTGVGAALLQLGVTWIEVHSLAEGVMAGTTNPFLLQQRIDTVTIGASGAVFGVLLAFGMMHPNAMIMLLIPPVPIKAKYFVIGYGVLELALGVSGAQSGVAHFAHVGGMLWGFFLLRYWKKTGKIFY